MTHCSLQKRVKSACWIKYTGTLENGGIIIFEVNIVDEQKQTQLVTIFLFFVSFHGPQPFYCSPALPLLRRPWRCMLCQQTSLKRWFANVTMTSYCYVTNSVYSVTMTTIRHCSIIELGGGFHSSSRPGHHQTSARHCLRACSKNNFSMINVFTLTNINTEIIGKLSIIYISEVYIKLVALRINRYQRRSSQFQKGWWPLHYSETGISSVEIIVGECSLYSNYFVQSSFSFRAGTPLPHLFFSTTPLVFTA